jgi:hypothetical protein
VEVFLSICFLMPLSCRMWQGARPIPRTHARTPDSIPLHLQGLSAYTNDQGTAHFLALDLAPHHHLPLQLLLRRVDRVLRAYGQPGFYADPRFHLSIARVPATEARAEPGQAGAAGAGVFAACIAQESGYPRLEVRASLFCRFGNQVYPLS